MNHAPDRRTTSPAIKMGYLKFFIHERLGSKSGRIHRLRREISISQDANFATRVVGLVVAYSCVASRETQATSSRPPAHRRTAGIGGCEYGIDRFGRWHRLTLYTSNSQPAGDLGASPGSSLSHSLDRPTRDTTLQTPPFSCSMSITSQNVRWNGEMMVAEISANTSSVQVPFRGWINVTWGV